MYANMPIRGRDKNQVEVSEINMATATAEAPKKEQKKETKPAAAAKPDKAQREQAAKNDRFVFVKDPDAALRVPPQARTILNAVKAAGKDGISRGDLVSLLEKGNALNTRQPVGRIITYYQPLLVRDNGLIKLEEKTPAAK